MSAEAVPPQNLDAEEHVLGAMLLSPAAIDAVREFLRPEEFYRGSHGVIYRSALELRDRGDPVDVITLCGELERRGELEEVGGRPRVHELAALVPAASNAAHYARLVAEAAVRREVATTAGQVADHARNGTFDRAEVKTLLERALMLTNTPRTESDQRLVVALDEFVSVEEPGADAILGGSDDAVIPEGGDVMVYGDGGAGKTTLMIDLACHLAAGDDWLGITVPRPVRVLLIENEGPRALFRVKLRRKRDSWVGSPLEDRVLVMEAPWAQLTLARDDWRESLAAMVREHAIDVVIVGPLSRIGMSEAGTLQDVAEFMALVADVRRRAERRCVVVLIHHENKGGKVSGAWEGSGDTLLHVSGEGNGRTRLLVQKARWASSQHGRVLHLAWADGEGFEVEEKPELDDDAVAELIVATIAATPGVSWTKVEKATPGVSKDRRRQVRDTLFAGARIVNVVKRDGIETVLHECPERQKASLYLADDPTLTHLRPASGAVAAQSAPASGGGNQLTLRPAPRPIGAQGVGAAHAPDDTDLERLDAIREDLGR